MTGYKNAQIQIIHVVLLELAKRTNEIFVKLLYYLSKRFLAKSTSPTHTIYYLNCKRASLLGEIDFLPHTLEAMFLQDLLPLFIIFILLPIPSTAFDSRRTSILNECPYDRDDWTGKMGNPCPPGWYCDNERPFTGVIICCECREPGTYCPGHREQLDVDKVSCFGERERGDNAPKSFCPIGTFSATPRASSCTACPAGKETAQGEGATSCQDCGPGWYAPRASQYCMQCPPGRFNYRSGAGECMACAKNNYTDGFGQSECKKCPFGSYSPEGAANCNRCLIGSEPKEYLDPDRAPINPQCQICGTGYYNDERGDICKPCPAGRFQLDKTSHILMDHDDEMDCKFCPTGRYSQSTAATECEFCVAGRYKEIQDGEPCNICEPGKASMVIGARNYSCNDCNTQIVDYLEEDAGRDSCKSISCKKGEFLTETGCEKCDVSGSFIMIFGSLVVVVLTGLYVEEVAQERQKMVQVKVLSTFFQTSELTTHVNIDWPSLAFYSLPFRLPLSSMTCITPEWWNTRWNFLLFIYVPIAFFLFIFEKWRNLPINSSEEKKLQQLGVFLGMLWYTPVLQSAASMYDCVRDDSASGTYYLRSDTSTPCQFESNNFSDWISSLDYIDIHAFLVGIFIGWGFPLYIIFTLRKAKRENKLNAASPYTALFEWYIPSMCWFEAVQMLRKAALITASAFPYSRLLTESWTINGIEIDEVLEQRIQGWSVLCINFGFLLLFLYSRPMVKEPSRIIKNLNLFSAAEALSITITIAGNVLAMIGSYQSQTVYAVGVIFALLNFLFAFSFLAVFALEIRKSNDASSSGSANWAKSTRFMKGKSKIGKPLRAALKNWALHVETIDRMDVTDQDFQTQMANEGSLIVSRVKVAVKDELKIKDESVEKVYKNLDDADTAIGFVKLRLRNAGVREEDCATHRSVVKSIKRRTTLEEKLTKMTEGPEVRQRRSMKYKRRPILSFALFLSVSLITSTLAIFPGQNMARKFGSHRGENNRVRRERSCKEQGP